MCVLIAIHRATDAAAEVDDWLRSLPDDLQRAVSLLGPLLRLADGLDVTRRQSVRWLDATIHDGLFDIVIRSKEKGKQEVKMAVERAELFEQAYGLHLAIDVKRKGAPPTGAESCAVGLGHAPRRRSPGVLSRRAPRGLFTPARPRTQGRRRGVDRRSDWSSGQRQTVLLSGDGSKARRGHWWKRTAPGDRGSAAGWEGVGDDSE
jgi:hypothetical protein